MIKRIAGVLAALIVACPAIPGASIAQDRGPLVLAAASLQEALTDAAGAWAAHRHSYPVLSFAGPSALARQIEAGGPADLFISADEEWMDYVARKNLIVPGTRVAFLSNRIVLVAHMSHPAAVSIGPGFPLARLLGSDRLAMADPDAVPAGRYGKAALENLKVWPSVKDRIAGAENVRAALQLVANGVAPYRIVYATDARAAPAVKVVGWFPAGSHPPIRYPIARLLKSSNRDAEGFRRFLLSPEAGAIFARRGFIVGRR